MKNTLSRRDVLAGAAASLLAAVPGCLKHTPKSEREFVGEWVSQIREQVTRVMDEGEERTVDQRLHIYNACQRRLRMIQEGHHAAIFATNAELQREVGEIEELIERALKTVDPNRRLPPGPQGSEPQIA